MKRSIYFNLLIAAALLISGAVGCQRKPKAPTPIPGATTRAPSTKPNTFDSEPVNPTPLPENSGAGGIRTTSPGGGEGVPLPPVGPDGMQQDTEFFKANTVHFAFDRSAVRAEDRSKIEAVGAHLKSDPTHRVRIAGYCDERGTVEYNVSLGEKRALAVREFLINLGISGDRIYTISFGESDPVDPAHTDAAYAKNRRAEFILLKP